MRRSPFPGVFTFIAATFFLLNPYTPSAQDVPGRETRSIAAHRATARVVFDGALDEPAWCGAAPAADFIQRELSEGERATERTEVRVLYDDTNIYIGVVCFDREPERIVHTGMSRDAEMGSDDTFTVVFDTFRDLRNGYYFQTNPNGARSDALIANGTHDHSWNGIWDTRARILDNGWSAEMVIPFKTLRFGAEKNQTWGVNFRRVIPRKNEEAYWTAWGRNDGIFQLSMFGKLEGLLDISRSRKGDFKPFVLAGLAKERAKSLDQTWKYGLDGKIPVTSDLTLDLTTFTDFAQVESDREQINLTRFDLSYPEKREFFLEGADIFSFASPVTTPFYSRKIGLTPDREQVPILGGAKLIGKTGDYTIGMIDMQTDDKDTYSATNYSVIRVKKDILEKSYIGFIGTNASPGGKPSTQAYGMDFLYRTGRFMGGQNLEFGGYLAENRVPGVTHANRAGRFLMNLPNDQFAVSLLYHAVGKNYNPETGFVQRGDIIQHKIQIDYTPRVSIRGVKKLLFMPVALNYYTDSGPTLMTRTIDYRPFGVELNSGDKAEFKIYTSYDNVVNAFERFRGRMNVPAGIYRWRDYEVEVVTTERRPVTFEMHAHRGEFYNGDRDNFRTLLGWRANRYVALSGDMTYQNITLSGNNFVVRDFGGRFTLNLSTRLTSGTLVQYNNETGEVNMNFRLHYIPKIGSDVYFVYNHLWDEEEDFRTLQNTGIFKMAYIVQF